MPVDGFADIGDLGIAVRGSQFPESARTGNHAVFVLYWYQATAHLYCPYNPASIATGLAPTNFALLLRELNLQLHIILQALCCSLKRCDAVFECERFRNKRL